MPRDEPKPKAGEDDTFDDDEVPTAITLRSLLVAPPAIPAITDEADRLAESEPTALNPKASTRFDDADAALPDFLRARLEFVGATGRTHELTMPLTVLGRSDRADVKLTDPKASRRHVTILFSAGEFRVRDEQSANGTLLNGSKVVEYALKDGDKILVGDTLIHFRVTAR
jgi:pSer/pThr/pTyr-binding forkhead associated (FHA) protein